MKTLVSFLLVFVCAVTLHAQKKIKSTYTVTYEAGDTLGTTKGNRMTYVNADYMVFNHGGQVLESKMFDGDSMELVRNTNVILDGKLVKTESFFNGVQGATTTFTYNEKGNIAAEAYEYPAYNVKTSTVYTYDSNDRLMKKEVLAAGGITERREYKYDENGVKTEEDMYSFSGTRASYLFFKQLFDKNGKITHSEYYGQDGKIISTYDWKYDDHGNKVEENGANEWTGITHTTWTYTYDKQGNWTRSVQFAGKRATAVVERTIVYY